MGNYLRRIFKRMYVKYLIKVRYSSFNHKQTQYTESEKICKSICYRLINRTDSKFLIAPISGKRYINNINLGLFVVMDDRRISITNHIYHYDVVLGDRDWERITKMYDDKTESIRQGFEDEIHSQINGSLQKILQKIRK